jgi:hypothetical protein
LYEGKQVSVEPIHMREDEAVRRGFIHLELAARYQEALAAADEIRAFEAEIHRLKGELLRRDDSAVAEAQSCLQRAIEIARRSPQ